MGKTRPIYGRFTRGLKPHEAAKGEGFTPELWKRVDVTGKPILIEHDWRNPGPVGSFVRNWVEYDQKTDEHWCCIEGEIDLEAPYGEKVVSDIKAGKYPAWSVSLIQSNPQLVDNVGSNREFLEGSLTNDPKETGTQVIVRHNGKGGTVPVTAVPMSVSLEPMQPQNPAAETKTEVPPAANNAPAVAASSVQPIETQQKAPDTLTKQEGQPLAPGVTTLSLDVPPVPPTVMADTLAKPAAAAAAADGQQQQQPPQANPSSTEAPKSTAKLNLAPPKKAVETEKKETLKKAAPKEDEVMKDANKAEEEDEDDVAAAEGDKAETIAKEEPAKKKESKPAETKKTAATAKPDVEMKKDSQESSSANPVKEALGKFASADPKNAELVVALMNQFNELKAESAKLREEREAEKAAQAAEKARIDQIRLKEAAAKYDFWAKNIDEYVTSGPVPDDEKDIARQVFESAPTEAGNKAYERLVDRLTDELATARQELAQIKKSRTNTNATPSGLSEEQLRSALDQLSNEFGGKGSSSQQEEPTKRKQSKSVSVKEPRDLAPTEIMVRHSKALSGIDSSSATARALAAFGDRVDIDINGHHAALNKKLEEVRIKKAQLHQA